MLHVAISFAETLIMLQSFGQHETWLFLHRELFFTSQHFDRLLCVEVVYRTFCNVEDLVMVVDLSSVQENIHVFTLSQTTNFRLFRIERVCR